MVASELSTARRVRRWRSVAENRQIVQLTQSCSTRIYPKDSPLDLKKLEDDVRDPHGGFRGHRICHHSDDACCVLPGLLEQKQERLPDDAAEKPF
jgi:hypothetical protein